MYKGAEGLRITEAVCSLYSEGYSIHEVATAAGVGKKIVSEIVKDHGLTRPKGRNAGWKKKNEAKAAEESKRDLKRTLEVVRTEAVAALPAPAAPMASVGVVCQQCGNTDHLEGSAFCCKCGCKLESRGRRLRRALRNLYALASKVGGENSELVKQDYDELRAYIDEHERED